MANEKKYSWSEDFHEKEKKRKGIVINVDSNGNILPDPREDAAKSAALSAYFKTVNASDPIYYRDELRGYQSGYRMAVNPDGYPF